MRLDPEELRPVITRLRRAQGQIGGVIAMIEDGRECRDIVTQLAAIGKAVDRAGFTLVSTGVRSCIANGGEDCEEDLAGLEKLFLSLA